MKAAVRFIRHGGIYRSDVSSHLADQGRSAAFRTGPTPAKRTRRKFPRPTHRRDEFRPAIPQRGARQQCPSPLHRQPYPKSVPGSGTMNLQRTVYSVLTLCLSQGDTPKNYSLINTTSDKKRPPPCPDRRQIFFRFRMQCGVQPPGELE
jgi:hypothetical protein